MYATSIVQQRLDIAEQELGFELEYHSTSETACFDKDLERKYPDEYAQAWAAQQGSQNPSRDFQVSLIKSLVQTKKLSQTEIRWMDNECSLATCDAAYWLTRYYNIRTPVGIQKFSFLPGQKVYFNVISELEALGAAIEIIACKARQHGISTETEGLALHRSTFYSSVNTTIASADQGMTGKMSRMAFLGYDLMPWWMRPLYTRRVESDRGLFAFGGINSQINFEHGNQMSSISRGDTITCYHLSEVASYSDAGRLIEDGLFKCVHANPTVFGVLESTAEGDTGWWYEKYWFAKKNWSKRRSRLCPLFLPWFMGTDKYPTETWLRTRPVPRDWRPEAETRSMAARAKLYVQSNPVLEKVLGNSWELPTAQLWFWEVNFVEHRDTGRMREWFQEMPTDDTEAFQGSYDNVFGREVIAQVYSNRKMEYQAFGLVGQSIEEKYEPSTDEVDYAKPRRAVRWKSHTGETYRWEFVPVEWKESWSDLEGLGDDDSHMGKLFIFHEPERGYDYSVGIDTSNGIGEDATVIAVCRRAQHPSDPDVQVAEFRSNRVSHVEAFAFAGPIIAYYSQFMGELQHHQPYIAVEQIMAVGDTCQGQLKKLGFTRMHNMVRYDSKKIRKSKAVKQGWYTNTWSRPMLTDGFVIAVQNGWYIVNSPWTIWEMDHWEVHLTKGGKSKFEHDSNATDDGIFANAMATFCPNDLKSLATRSTRRLPEERESGRMKVDFGAYSGQVLNPRGHGTLGRPKRDASRELEMLR